MSNIFQVCKPVCNILDRPNGNLIRQMLYGDRLDVISDIGEWVKCKRYSDGYGGYVKKSHLINWVSSTSKVCSFGAQIYKKPNMKWQIHYWNCFHVWFFIYLCAKTTHFTS